MLVASRAGCDVGRGESTAAAPHCCRGEEKPLTQLKTIVLPDPLHVNWEKVWERGGSGQQFSMMKFLRKWHLFLVAECFNEKEENKCAQL